MGIPLVLLLDRQGGWAFCAVLAAVSVVAAQELENLFRSQSFRPLSVIAFPACAAMALLPAVTPRPQMAWLVVLSATLVLSGSIVLHPARFATGTRDWLATVVIPVYIGLFLASLGLLRDARQGEWWVFFALVTTWAYDTGAYASGRLFGRHPFMAHVSPKKTAEGVAGGLVTATVAGTFAAPVIGIQLWQALLLGLLAGAVAQAGDLLESMVKRNGNVKDSGAIIPGHGGLLDRIDSLLFVAPFFLLMAFALSYGP